MFHAKVTSNRAIFPSLFLVVFGSGLYGVSGTVKTATCLHRFSHKEQRGWRGALLQIVTREQKKKKIPCARNILRPRARSGAVETASRAALANRPEERSANEIGETSPYWSTRRHLAQSYPVAHNGIKEQITSHFDEYLRRVLSPTSFGERGPLQPVRLSTFQSRGRNAGESRARRESSEQNSSSIFGVPIDTLVRSWH